MDLEKIKKMSDKALADLLTSNPVLDLQKLVATEIMNRVTGSGGVNGTDKSFVLNDVGSTGTQRIIKI